MKRTMLSALLVAAACGGGGKKTTTTGGGDVAGGDVGAGDPGARPADPVDPQLAARQSFSNPGGMWMPQQMTLPGHADIFQKLGVSIPPARLADPLADPLASIISLGGCSASFVSPDGLIVTNHHCVQGALQFNVTADFNPVENGYLAKTRADEKSAGPTQKVYVAQAFTDVTAKMRDGLEKITSPTKRKDEVEKRLKALVAGCEKDRPGLHCKVVSYFNSGMFVLIEHLEIRDVRIVYVPHRSVGNYGGEVDNWMWPRHTGDFAFYRAYVGKDGKPADFAPENVPYQPKHYLKVSTAGVKANDFVMVTGYPGSTERTHTAAEVRHDVEWYYPYLIAHYQQRYDLAEQLVKAGGVTGIKAGVAKQFIQNTLANAKGTLEGLTSGDLLARKDALDAKIKEWAAQPGHEQVKAQIEKYEALLAEKRQTARVDYDRQNALYGSRVLATALSFTRWAEERPKKDADRKPGYQDRDMPRAVAGQKAFLKSYDRTLDRANFRLSLVRALELAEADRPWLATIVGAKKGQKIDTAMIDRALDRLYKTTKLEDEKVRLELLQKGTTKQLKASKDPFVKLALALWPDVKAKEKKDDALGGELVLVSPGYVTAMREVLGGLLAPDANGTLRITYGTVKSFKPGADEASWPFTTTAQILKKNTGKEPFDAPPAQLEAIKAKKYGPYAVAALGGEVPVDFLSDLDITGGNSGSATLNDKGELVGLAFDGTLAGVASDVVFNGETTRTIHADVRYMLWHMDAVDQADHVLAEMGVKPVL